MRAVTGQAGSALGFLSVIEHESLGLFGGFLILNAAGRPIEFHCTAPLKPSRAEQILYGPTLKPYLYGEQIGLSLFNKSAVPPPLVLTDVRDVLSVREFVDTPVVLVADQRASSEGQSFSHGCNRLIVEGSRLEDQAPASQILSEIAESFDLLEPFGRIHEAIQEAQRVGRTA